MNDRIVRVDEHVVVACRPQDALSCLDGPTAIAAWFGGDRSGSRTTIASPAGELVLERAHEEWLPDDGALLVVGTTGDLWFRAHLTVRSVMRPVRTRTSTRAPRSGPTWSSDRPIERCRRAR